MHTHCRMARIKPEALGKSAAHASITNHQINFPHHLTFISECLNIYIYIKNTNTILYILYQQHTMYHCVFFLCGKVKEITYETSHLPPRKHRLIRACVIGQEKLSATN